MLSLSFSRLFTSSIPRGSLCTRINKHAIKKEETITSLGAADLITSNSS
jgi:hypothetical protein